MKRNKGNIAMMTLLATMILLATGFIFSACSTDDTTPTPNTTSDSEISLNTEVWNFITRATTIDNAAALQEHSFMCYAFEDGSATQYISGSTVSYAAGEWTFDDGKHYWPDAGALNFFAHLPAVLTNTYCSFDPTEYADPANPDGYSEDCPRIVCTNLPVAITKGSDDTKELVVAYTAAQTKAANSAGVNLTFMHPFARVRFKLASASGTNVKVNSVTIPGVKQNGLFTFNGTVTTWTPDGADVDFVLSGNPATDDDAFYLVIPNNYGTKTLTVNATWSDWGTATKDVSANVNFNWEVGNSYTYTLTLSKEGLIVDTSKYTEQW